MFSVRSCLLSSLIRCLEGHVSRGSPREVDREMGWSVGTLVDWYPSQGRTRSPIELFWLKAKAVGNAFVSSSSSCWNPPPRQRQLWQRAVKLSNSSHLGHPTNLCANVYTFKIIIHLGHPTNLCVKCLQNVAKSSSSSLTIKPLTAM